MISKKKIIEAFGLILLMSPTASFAAGGNPPVTPCPSKAFKSFAGLPEVPGCPGNDQPRAEVPDLAPPAFSRTRRISKTFVVDRPGTYDFGNELLDWSGPETCKPQKDAPPAIIVRSSNVTIKNLGVHGAPGGIQVLGVNVTLDNVTAWSCGAAVSVVGDAGRIFIKNSHFYGNPEFKEVLLDMGTGNFSVENTLFSDSEACLQFGGGQDATISGSDFVGCKDSILGNTLNNQRFSTLLSTNNESWYGETFLHLIGHVRGTSRTDVVYDGAKKKLEKDANLIEE